jgi:anti-sigma B factor antagonist
MKFASRMAGDVVVFDLKGGLEGGQDTYQIKEVVHGMLQEGRRKFLLNLNQIDFVNSTGIGIIAAVFSSISSAGGQMKISNANNKVSRVMIITKLMEVFDSYADEAEALRAFGVADPGKTR